MKDLRKYIKGIFNNKSDDKYDGKYLSLKKIILRYIMHALVGS